MAVFVVLEALAFALALAFAFGEPVTLEALALALAFAFGEPGPVEVLALALALAFGEPGPFLEPLGSFFEGPGPVEVLALALAFGEPAGLGGGGTETGVTGAEDIGSEVKLCANCVKQKSIWK